MSLKKMFNLPDFVNGIEIYSKFFELKKKFSYAFYEDCEVMSIFGCFPNCVWNGGGYFCNPQFYNGIMVKDIVTHYKNLGIPIRFTFTNPSLDEKHFEDTYANLICELAQNGNNEILTSDDRLEAYLRKNYPNYKYCKSIIGTENEPVFLDDKYYITVMKRFMNNNWTYLGTIPMSYRHKIEFLCTDPCPDGCPRIYSHYKEHGKTQLTYGLYPSPCTMYDVKGPFQNKYARGLKTFITLDMIENDYIPRGFNCFKISGRGNHGAMISGIMNYLTKPDYREDIMEMLIMEIDKDI